MYIVELEKGVWLAPGDGDPSRTLKKENAKQFRTTSSANRALKNALQFGREFVGSRVINLKESTKAL
jgi:hypothetical protein